MVNLPRCYALGTVFYSACRMAPRESIAGVRPLSNRVPWWVTISPGLKRTRGHCPLVQIHDVRWCFLVRTLTIFYRNSDKFLHFAIFGVQLGVTSSITNYVAPGVHGRLTPMCDSVGITW